MNVPQTPRPPGPPAVCQREGGRTPENTPGNTLQSLPLTPGESACAPVQSVQWQLGVLLHKGEHLAQVCGLITVFRLTAIRSSLKQQGVVVGTERKEILELWRQNQQSLGWFWEMNTSCRGKLAENLLCAGCCTYMIVLMGGAFMNPILWMRNRASERCDLPRITTANKGQGQDTAH